MNSPQNLRRHVSAREAIPCFTLEEPYPGAKPMILVDDVDNPDFLAGLLRRIFDDLPEGKGRVSRGTRLP